jgi:tetratricopeptide (TPR) repeat protein
MEYANSGELASAVTEFRGLISQNPNYSAAYYHAGRALEKLGQIDDARAVYEQGMEATRRTGDAHTYAEIEQALNLLPI